MDYRTAQWSAVEQTEAGRRRAQEAADAEPWPEESDGYLPMIETRGPIGDYMTSVLERGRAHRQRREQRRALGGVP